MANKESGEGHATLGGGRRGGVGGGGGIVDSVTATPNTGIAVGGTATDPVLSGIPATEAVPGTMSAADKTTLDSGLLLRQREMVDTSIRIDVTQLPATEIEFLGLDGDSDADYEIEFYIKCLAGGNLKIIPEGDLVNTKSRGLFTNGVGLVSPVDGGNTLLIFIPGVNTINGIVRLQSRKGEGPRLYSSLAYENDNYMAQFVGLWNDTTTPLTKVSLNFTANSIDVGSWAILRKLKTNVPTTTIGGGSPAMANILSTTRMAVLGDSIPSTAYNTFLPIWTKANAYFGGIAPLVNAGNPGDTVDDVLKRTQADIVDVVPQPNFVIVYMGRNSLGGDIADILLQYGRTLDIMIQGGIPPANIVCVSVFRGEIWPLADAPLQAFNTGVAGLAALRGCVFADIDAPMYGVWEPINNPANDLFGHMLIDTSHPNAIGVANISNFPAGWMWSSLALVP